MPSNVVLFSTLTSNVSEFVKPPESVTVTSKTNISSCVTSGAINDACAESLFDNATFTPEVCFQLKVKPLDSKSDAVLEILTSISSPTILSDSVVIDGCWLIGCWGGVGAEPPPQEAKSNNVMTTKMVFINLKFLLFRFKKIPTHMEYHPCKYMTIQR